MKIFKASNFSYTPFNDFVEGDLSFLKMNGIEIVDSPWHSDVIISQNYKHLKKYFWLGCFGKSFLVWTLEPRFDLHFAKVKKVFFGLFKCHIMNVYTQDVFVTNLSVSSNNFNKSLELLPEEFELKTKKTIALMSYFKGIESPPIYRGGVDLDLLKLRAEIALEGHQLGVLDVFGKGWPHNISKEDSRTGNWKQRKRKLMNDYSFNLCFENTVAKNYMTEKIWDSIENYCLPIYYGRGTTAYELFPKDSFIDYAEFSSPEALFTFIQNMSDEDYRERMNKCIIVHNNIFDNKDIIASEERKKMLTKITDKMNYIQSLKR
ncbi:glycosyltransferase family 10 domain-containing protein [Gelidibacter gilvus]|uniref:Glycosyl transferase n=1 Tax=Gelidibacter gilvus TaxID=59602 RepID=A0A4Q0XEA0_9FLAO|nr:glycosyltransferase family 10 [Gelidibacter gilvus]RXJ45404.1 glycosyl transferase [Gelidibacter gilvus]